MFVFVSTSTSSHLYQRLQIIPPLPTSRVNPIPQLGCRGRGNLVHVDKDVVHGAIDSFPYAAANEPGAGIDDVEAVLQASR